MCACQCLCGHILSGSNHIQLLVLWLLCLQKMSLQMRLSIAPLMMKHGSKPPSFHVKTWHTGVFSPGFVICLSKSTAEQTSRQNKANRKRILIKPAVPLKKKKDNRSQFSELKMSESMEEEFWTWDKNKQDEVYTQGKNPGGKRGEAVGQVKDKNWQQTSTTANNRSPQYL